MATTTRSAPLILYVAAVDWWFALHRMHIAVAARDAGFRVAVATREGEYTHAIREAGLDLFPVDIHRTSVSPLRAARDVAALRAIYRRVRPDILHHLAIRPSVLGSAAAALTGSRPVVNNLAGMGRVFTDPASARTRAIRHALLQAFRIAFNRAGTTTIVENSDDYASLVAQARVRPEHLALIPSVGVDLDRFLPAPHPNGTTVVSMAARLLAFKGVLDFVEAARLLARRRVPVRMRLVGSPDPAHPESIPEAQLRRWHEEGCIEWLGWRGDMPSVWAESSVAVLPTYYREGIPGSLLEAAATARPLIASDMPGCREVVLDGVTGLLIPPRNPERLAAAIEELVGAPERRVELGRAGRKLVEEQFAAPTVQARTVALYHQLLGRRVTTEP